jgi:hypothetical protein
MEAGSDRSPGGGRAGYHRQILILMDGADALDESMRTL